MEHALSVHFIQDLRMEIQDVVQMNVETMLFSEMMENVEHVTLDKFQIT